MIVTVTTGESVMAENGKKSNFELMDEMEKKQKTTYDESQHDGIDYWKRNERRTLFRALSGLDLKLPWIMLAGMFILAVNDLIGAFPSWVDDMAVVIAIAGAVQYIVSIAVKIYHKKNGE